MHTSTAKLSDDVFEKMKSLWSIIVAHTEIKTIKRNIAKIEYLPDDLFDEMPALKSVGFTNNRISFLKEATFQGVFSQIAVLNVVDNPIVCDCSIEWITLSNNKKVLGKCGGRSLKQGKMIKDLTQNDSSIVTK
ncbi:hypothetical protein CEXT_347341 [Caerostris extrusa]|uniref:Uncharacterized protein n=1 Tax=Caerostris extrusa TaxID=172846 RepID=A0AAV4U1H2_CAEEX|nr:hypothetical protein CEXT_347341 [Caerostris extrusa]